MGLYKITYQVEDSSYQPVRLWAEDEAHALCLSTQQLILAGYCVHKLREMIKLGGK